MMYQNSKLHNFQEYLTLLYINIVYLQYDDDDHKISIFVTDIMIYNIYK